MNATTLRQTDSRTLPQLLAAGLLTELSYMTSEQAADAIELECWLLADAQAGDPCSELLAGWTVGAAL